MKPGRTGLNALAVFAILFLLGLGFVVYAVPSPAVAPLDSSTTSSQGGVYFRLVQVNPTTAKGGNASGYAGIAVNGETLKVGWYISGAMPGEQLQLMMQVTASGRTATSYPMGSAEVSSQGTAGSGGTGSLDPGSYSIGLIVVDSSTHKTVLTSVPTSAQISVGSSQTTTQTTAQTYTATGNSLPYSLVPFPVYLHQESPANYAFKEGGALIVVYGNQLQLTTSFLGLPNTAYANVIQTGNQNVTAGTVTTGQSGGGVYKGDVTLASGTYKLGVLIYLASNSSAPVAVSVPRAIQITLPLGGSTSTTSSTTHSSTYPTTTTSTHSSTTTTYSQTTTTSKSSTTSQYSENRLSFSPITVSTAPHGYAYGQGNAAYLVSGSNLYFSLAFTGQNPNTHYSLSLSVNGTARTIGNYTTNSDGEGHAGAGTTLGNGKFVLSLHVVDTSTFNQPTPVLVSDPPTFVVTAYASSTTTTSTHTTSTTSTTSSTSHTNEGHSWIFKLTPATVANVPSGYRFASSGTAVVTLTQPFSLLHVELGFQDGNPSTTYNAALVLNGTATNIGTMTTNKAGAAELHGSIQVSPGTYLLGIMVFDVSDIAAFKAQGPVLVMVSDPNTRVAVIIAPNSHEESRASSSEGGSEGSTVKSSLSSTYAHTKSGTTITGGADVEDQIQKAVDNLTIPASVQVTPLQSSTNVRDSRFSLSVGQQAGSGLVIAISGENITGPRVLLINMSKTSPLALYPALNVTLDGTPVAEASSATQVLNPAAGDPPRYVLVGTASSIQLLVSIPHFSLHLIQVAGAIVHTIETTLQVDAPLLAGSMLVITLAFAAAYAARKRFFAIL